MYSLRHRTVQIVRMSEHMQKKVEKEVVQMISQQIKYGLCYRNLEKSSTRIEVAAKAAV